MAENLGHIMLMVLLLGCSAFFSGCETAFFNLSRRQTEHFSRSDHKLQRIAAGLLSNPGRLLGCLLFGNMTVNVLYFALASVLTVRVAEQIGLTAATAAAVVNFALLVIVGEIIPKSIAYSNSRNISVLAALPVYLCVRLFGPVVSVFRLFIETPALRLLLGPAKHPRPITTTEFKTLFEHVRKQGLITSDENKLLTETVELAHLKVRHTMCPRVDMVACDVTEPPEKAEQLMMSNNLTKIPVYVKNVDNIVGLVHLRQILLRPDTTLDKLVEKVHFVPEQKTVESLLEFFRRAHTDTAVVVDEYGGIAGAIRLEDIAEELLGPIEKGREISPAEVIGPLRYRLAGNCSIHDWADVFGINVEQMKVSTLAGLVTALLGRIPKASDVAHLNNITFTVEQVKQNRIKTIILALEPIENDSE